MSYREILIRIDLRNLKNFALTFVYYKNKEKLSNNSYKFA